MNEILIKKIQNQCNNLQSFDNKNQILFDILIAKYKEEYKGLGDYVSRKVLHRQINDKQIIENFDCLNNLNQEGWNIYVRPSDFYQNSFFVIDDVSKANLYQINNMINSYWSLEQYKTDFKLVDIIKTSENSHQVWLYNKNTFHLIDKNHISNCLADLFNADKACADIGKFSRLVGFRNVKPEHIRDDKIVMVEQDLHFYDLFKQQENNVLNNSTTQSTKSNDSNPFDDFDSLENLLNEPISSKSLKIK
jgi:hypothetical protein